ncbi:protein rep [Clostridium perfringens]
MYDNNYNEKTDKKQTILSKCTDKKLKNPKFADFISPFVSVANVERISDCGSFLMMLGDMELENIKLHKSNFCGNRFCPMCSWRTACKESLEISILMEYLRKEENKEFIFLTLTTPNIKGYELEESIKNYNKSFKKLMERKEVKAIAKGYIRKLEVTYQKDKFITKELWKRKKDYYINKGLSIGDEEPNYDTYNPHFHVVIAVSKSYFTDTKKYINRDRWLELWRASTGDNRITQVDIKKARFNDYKEVYELAKYSAKDTDYLINRNVFRIFYKALKGKQLIVFGGMFKDAHKMYQNGKLDAYKEIDEIEYTYMLYYNWHKNNYENSKIRDLTPEEKEIINKQFIQDLDLE